MGQCVNCGDYHTGGMCPRNTTPLIGGAYFFPPKLLAAENERLRTLLRRTRKFHVADGTTLAMDIDAALKEIAP